MLPLNWSSDKLRQKACKWHYYNCILIRIPLFNKEMVSRFSLWEKYYKRIILFMKQSNGEWLPCVCPGQQWIRFLFQALFTIRELSKGQRECTNKARFNLTSPIQLQKVTWLPNLVDNDKFCSKIHYLAREFHVKFHAKNRYRMNREAMN